MEGSADLVDVSGVYTIHFDIEYEDGDGEGDFGKDDDGSLLPDTATSTFNWILGGFVALASGIAGIFTSRRKSKNKS